MKQVQDSLKTDSEYTSLTRKLKMKQIKDGLKTDSEYTSLMLLLRGGANSGQSKI